MLRNFFTRNVPAPSAAPVPANANVAEWRSKGNVLLAEGRLAEATVCYEIAVQLGPQDAPAHLNLGFALTHLGQMERAESALRSAVSLDSTVADGWFLLGQALNARSEWTEAEHVLRKALVLQAGFHFARRELVQTLASAGRLQEALNELDLVFAEFEQDAAVWQLRGNLQFALKQAELAEKSYARATLIDPTLMEPQLNRAVALHKCGRHAEALTLYERVLSMQPHFPPAVYNLGRLLLDECRCEAALALCDEALRIHPEDANIHINRADALLLLGQLERAWPEYEWRWSADGLGQAPRRPDHQAPVWTGGEAINGATILLMHEQGLGDTIQFMRYASVLAARGAKVVVQLPPPLHPLFAHDPALTLVAEGQPIPACDFQLTLPSVPMALRTSLQTIPRQVPYVAVDQRHRAQWDRFLGPHQGLRVGLVWSGNAAHNNDAHRSIPLATLLSHAPSGIQWVSLQKEVRERDAAAMAESMMVDTSSRLASFAETAALVDLMDLVISVDTSVAHLAGALGKKLFVLLPFRPDWRWMLDREDSPWYPTARLFRQDRTRNWAPVIQRVMDEVSQMGTGG